LALVAVCLAFIAVFVATYMHGAAPRTFIDRPQAVHSTPPASELPAPHALRSATRDPAARATMAGSVGSPRFTICHTGGGENCVVDGDTVWIHGEKIRVADIDAPETHPPRCASEAQLGSRATQRLAELLNQGPFEQRMIDRDTDRYGRRLRIIVRRARSLGDQLVSEGLARKWVGSRLPWC
jgi:endonuclease YncB( thermonuclease family)